MLPWLILLAIFVCVLIFAKSTGHFFRCILASSVCGLLSLLAIGLFAEGWLSFNLYSICASVVVGIPGVLTTVILHFLLA